MQTLTQAYEEISDRISSQIPAVKWIDLWHNQAGFLQEEHPFKTPAVFLAFRTVSGADLGQKVQDANVQVDFYLYFETFADTFKGSYNQNSALEFLKLLDKIHKFFHGYSGEFFSEMRHVSTRPVDTGSAGNLYCKSFSCNMRDYEAQDEEQEVFPGNIPSGLFTL